MPRLAANLSLLWTELPYLERFAAAAEAGFEGVEVLFPYDLAAQETRRALISAGLDFVLMNAPPPNYAGGTPGYAALPGGEDRFARDIRRVLRYAELLRPAVIHVMAGEAEGPQARETFVRNLQAAADTAPGQIFTVEPLNPGSFPGYFLCDYDQAIEILDAVDRPNVGLQYDSFHASEIHGDALAVWSRVAPRVVHVQIGDAPGRGAPGSGSLDFKALFAAIEASGYDGWISAEYQPGTRTEKTLRWMKTGSL
ncbi:hydroxypyruvate isomerase family protein [Marinibacterium profundimaris]|uniref:Hydroxypyruvate isomerase n=1 Tax=Marinibacterium profundimaris TaxID=1679460 RepID=A0A225NNE4_9RHOB|nr:TIM barrel protein [Marinibacterium profundimaris]OWU76034.1 hydroxypyruvate isomerase [Marinibacterium profundimaris]